MARLFRKNGSNGRNATQKRNDGARGRIADLDELSKINRGGFSAFAEDTGAAPGYMLPYSKKFIGQLGGQPIQRQPRQAVELPDLSLQPDQGADTGSVLGQSTGDASGFLDAFNQAYIQANPTYAGTDQTTGSSFAQPVQTTADGGTMWSDGIIYYDDGTYRQGDPGAEAYASDASGGTRYSDGSLKIAQNYQPTEGGMSTQGGLQGLTYGIFGQQRPITQEFGNINPIEPTPGNRNLGVDIRTRDLEGGSRGYKLPVGAQVVDIYASAQPGSGSVGNMENQGYGNSILVKLPTGEMLRFSHMDQVGNYKPGDVIQPGETFGVPGSTGNVTGEHLDLEFYDQSGQIADPSTFSGFQNPGLLTTVQPKQYSSVYDQQPTQPQPQQPQQSVEQPQQPTPVADAGMNVLQNAPVAGLRAAQQIAPQLQPQSPQRQQAAQTVANIGQQAGRVLGVSDITNPGFVGASEAVAGDLPAAGRELSQTIERANLTPRVDTGLSELLRGDVSGARKNFEDTLNRVKSRLSQVPQQAKDAVINPAFADNGEQKEPRQTFGQNLTGAAESIKNYAGAKAGEGLQALKGSLSGFFNRPEPQNIGQERKVGEVSGTGDITSQGSPVTPALDQSKTQQQGQLNDIRDPFFKTGQVEQFKNYLTPGSADGQALTTDIFKPEFFESEKTGFRDVFGDTGIADQAEEKYTENRRRLAQEMRQNLIQQHGDPLQYDVSEVQRLASEIPDVLPEGFEAPTPTHRTPSLRDYLGAGKTPAQWYAEIRGQGELDRISKDPSLQYDPGTGTIRSPYSGDRKQADAPEPTRESTARRSQLFGSGGSRSIKQKSGRIAYPRPGEKLAIDLSGGVQSYDPGTTKIGNEEVDLFSPTKTTSAQLSKPLFTKKKEPGIFARFFGRR